MKNIITLLFGLLSFVIFAQDFQGTAIYQWKQSSEDFKKTVLANPKMNPSMKKIIEERMGRLFNKTFVLNFDKNRSIYKEEEKLDLNKQSSSGDWSPNGIIVSYLKNIKTKESIAETDLMSKMFNVQNYLTEYKWQLEPETKQIGVYLCNKAIASLQPTSKELQSFKEDKEEQEKNPTQFLKIEEPKQKTVTAWYTSEIPINQGPEDFWGLPGLILETNDGKTTIICSKITLNLKQKIDFKTKNHKTISQKEFDLLVEKKNKELENVDFTK